MFKIRFLSMLVLLAAVATGAWADWTGGTYYTATANENLGAITVNGDATLTINSGVTVTVTGGINVASGTLTVTGPGTLVVTGAEGTDGGTGGVAISGNIIVQGGATVTATGGTGGNGENGGEGGTGGVAISGNIIVHGGATVTATGGTGGTGGYGESGGTGGTGGVAISGNIIVQGGATVTATGGNGGNGGDGNMNGGNGGNAFAVTLTAVTGDNWGSGESPVQLVDGKKGTKWGAGGDCPHSAIFKSDLPLTPASYVLRIANDTNSNPGRNWKTWKIYGGNFASDDEAKSEDAVWNLIDTQTDIELPTDQYKECTITVSGEDKAFYSYFKIVIEHLVSDGQYMQMDEFWFEDAGTLTYKSGTVTANGGSGGSGGRNLWEHYGSSGSDGKAFANDVDFTQTTGYSVTDGTSTITTISNQKTVVISGGIPTGYSVSLKSGTEDATSWQGKAGEGEYLALPLEGVAAGTAVSVKYSGTKKVKSVKAKKKAPALNLTSPAVGQVIGDDGKNYDYASLPGGVTAQLAPHTHRRSMAAHGSWPPGTNGTI